MKFSFRILMTSFTIITPPPSFYCTPSPTFFKKKQSVIVRQPVCPARHKQIGAELPDCHNHLLSDHCSPHNAARKSGQGPPQARLSNNGKRVAHRPCESLFALHGYAAFDFFGICISLPRQRALPLALSDWRFGGVVNSLCVVHEEILSLA